MVLLPHGPFAPLRRRSEIMHLSGFQSVAVTSPRSSASSPVRFATFWRRFVDSKQVLRFVLRKNNIFIFFSMALFSILTFQADSRSRFPDFDGNAP
jgi:hypothetical protein